MLLALFVAIYVRVTPHREFQLIREGNMAAAFSLSGAILGFIVPLSAAVRYSVNLADMAIWGLIALVVQIAAFVVVRVLVPDDHRRHRRGQGRPGLLPGHALAGRGAAQRRLHELLSWRISRASSARGCAWAPGAQFSLRARCRQPCREVAAAEGG